MSGEHGKSDVEIEREECALVADEIVRGLSAGGPFGSALSERERRACIDAAIWIAEEIRRRNNAQYLAKLNELKRFNRALKDAGVCRGPDNIQ